MPGGKFEGGDRPGGRERLGHPDGGVAGKGENEREDGVSNRI